LYLTILGNSNSISQMTHIDSRSFGAMGADQNGASGFDECGEALGVGRPRPSPELLESARIGQPCSFQIQKERHIGTPLLKIGRERKCHRNGMEIITEMAQMNDDLLIRMLVGGRERRPGNRDQAD
jgi:hypothetical protein